MTWVDEWGTLDRKPYRTSKKRWSDRRTRTSGITSGRRSRSCTRKRTRRQTPDFGRGSRFRPDTVRSRFAEVSSAECRDRIRTPSRRGRRSSRTGVWEPLGAGRDTGAGMLEKSVDSPIETGRVSCRHPSDGTMPSGNDAGPSCCLKSVRRGS